MKKIEYMIHKSNRNLVNNSNINKLHCIIDIWDKYLSILYNFVIL
jgi:hypothetical protein